MDAPVDSQRDENRLGSLQAWRTHARLSIGELMGAIAILALILAARRIHGVAAVIVSLWTLPSFVRTIVQQRGERRFGWNGGPWDALGLFFCWTWVCLWELVRIALVLAVILLIVDFLSTTTSNPHDRDGWPFIFAAITGVFIYIYLKRVILHANLSNIE